MTNKPPAFQFYWEAFDRGTKRWTCEQVGAYIRLLIESWDKGGLPNDHKKLAVIAGCKPRTIEVIASKFFVANQLLYNKKLEEVRENQKRFNESRSHPKNKPSDNHTVSSDNHKVSKESVLSKEEISKETTSLEVVNSTKEIAFIKEIETLMLYFNNTTHGEKFKKIWEQYLIYLKNDWKENLSLIVMEQRLINLSGQCSHDESKMILQVAQSIGNNWKLLYPSREEKAAKSDKNGLFEIEYEGQMIWVSQKTKNLLTGW